MKQLFHDNSLIPFFLLLLTTEKNQYFVCIITLEIVHNADQNCFGIFLRPPYIFLEVKSLALGPVQESALTHSKHCSHFKASHMEALNTGHQID